MRVVIQDNYEKMSLWAAHYIANKINSHKEDRPFVLGLPTGSSPIGVYTSISACPTSTTRATGTSCTTTSSIIWSI